VGATSWRERSRGGRHGKEGWDVALKPRNGHVPLGAAAQLTRRPDAAGNALQRQNCTP